MIGAIIGDIVGSRFEFNNHRSTDFQLFNPDCTFTDDTICTVAVAEWLLQDTKYLTAEQLTKIMRKWCRKYPNPAGGYGGSFQRWIWDESMGAYNSFGNGSAMRVSPVAWAFEALYDCNRAAVISAEISHDHPEGIKGAQSVAYLIAILRRGVPKGIAIQETMKRYRYKETDPCIVLSYNNTFDETCQGTIPVCLQCLKESTDFESAIRLAVSIGGDTDTIAAIVGSLAEAAYGVPEEIWRQALPYLPQDMINVISNFIKTFGYGKQ